MKILPKEVKALTHLVIYMSLEEGKNYTKSTKYARKNHIFRSVLTVARMVDRINGLGTIYEKQAIKDSSNK